MKKIELKNGQMLTIRDVKKEDGAKFIEYLNKISSESDFLTFGEGEIKITVEQEESIIEASLKAPNIIFIVAQIEGQIVGSLNFNGGPRPRIMHTGEFGISVLKEYWELGIGKALIEYLLEWGKYSGIIRKINLRVRADNERGIKLYTKLGFIKEGIITRDIYMNGKFYDSFLMGIQID